MRAEHPSWRPSGFVVTAIAFAVFGPYVSGSVRTEQATVYAFLLLALPMILTRLDVSMGKRIFIPWVLYIIVGSIGVISPILTPMPYPDGDLLAGYDNVLLPGAIMLIVWSVARPRESDRLLELFCRIISIGMALNGLIAILSTRIEMTPLLRPFWSTSGDATTTAENAESVGRFSGILNHPAEAGALYSIAGLAAIYVWRNRAIFLGILLTLMTIGGVISVSKVFILGGLPLVVGYWVWSQRGERKLALLFGLPLVLLGVLRSGILSEWTGSSYLDRLFTRDQEGLVSLYSAGRFNNGSPLYRVVGQAWQTNPITGVGLRGWAVQYDGAIAEALIVGGLLGLVLYGLVLVNLFTLSTGLSGSARVFAFLIAACVGMSSFGFSPLTANRVSTVVWMLAALLVLKSRKEHMSDPEFGSFPTRSGRADLVRSLDHELVD